MSARKFVNSITTSSASPLGRITAVGGDFIAATDLPDLSGTYQPLDADLTAIAALAGTNTIYYRSAANTWSAVTIGTGLTFAGGTLSASGATLDINGLTAADPAYADYLPDYSAAAGANRKMRADYLLALGDGTPGGRLSTDTNSIGVATSSSTLYYVAHNHDRLKLFDGTRWQVVTLPGAGCSIALSGLSTSFPYDVFAYLSAGAPALELLAWTSITTRATALARQNGVWVKSGDPTRLYLGTVVPLTATTVADQDARRYVFNAYNRVPRRLFACPSAADDNAATSYTFNSTNYASLIAGAYAAAFVSGLDGHAVDVSAFFDVTNPTAGAFYGGIGVDSVASAEVTCPNVQGAGASAYISARLSRIFSAGFHGLAMVGRTTAASATLFADRPRFGSTSDPSGTYMMGTVMM